MNYSAIARFKGFGCGESSGQPVWEDNSRPAPSAEEWAQWSAEYDESLQLASQWKASLEDGYTDTEFGIKLKTTEEAQAWFAKGLVLVNTALQLGKITNDTVLQVWDYNGVVRNFTAAQYRSLMVNYGLYCMTNFNNLKP